MADNGVLPHTQAFRTGARSLFDGLRHWIAGRISTRARFHPVAGLDLFLNPDRLSRRLKAADRGAADGAKNMPPPYAEELSQFEVAVRINCNDAMLRLKRQTDAMLIGYEAKLFAIDIQPIGTALERVEAEAERRFQTLRQAKTDVLVGLRKDELLAGRELRRFTVEHRLGRMCKPLHPIALTLGLLILMVIVEGVANSAIFSHLTTAGQLGGFEFAALIACCNVGFAFAIGTYGLRNLIHDRPHRRIMAAIGSVAAIGLLLFLQFNLAKFRALVEQGSGLPTVSALLTEPVDWTLPAGALLVISLGFAAIAMLDGFTIAGDPYPGYSEMARRRQNAVEVYRRALLSFKREAERLIKVAQGQVKALVDQAKASLFAYQVLTADFRSIVQLYEQNAHQIENACNHVIKDYRDKNAFVRTEAAPAYFDHYLPLDWAIGREIGDPGTRLGVFTATVDDIEHEAENAKTRLHNLLVRQLADIETDLAAIENTAILLADREHAVFRPAADLAV